MSAPSLVTKLERFLSDQQNSRGIFKSFAIDKNGVRIESLSTIYFSALSFSILTDPIVCLPSLHTEQLLILFLKQSRRERSTTNTYNYWLRRSNDFRNRPIPDDWDDTALMYAVLSQHVEYQTPRAYQLLKRAKDPKTSLFQTWIFANGYPKKWHDLDLWVNLNIAYWLILEDVLVPDMWERCLEGIEQKDQSSRYYLDYWSADFFFIRTAVRVLERPENRVNPALRKRTTKVLTAVVQRTRKNLTKRSITCINTAWGTATLKAAGAPLEQYRQQMRAAVHKLLEAEEGKLEPTILGWQQKEQTVYDCSPALTASLLLAALTTPAQKDKITPNAALIPKAVKPLITTLRRSDFTEEVIGIPQEISHLLCKQLKERDITQSTVNALGWAYYWLDDQVIDNHPYTLPEEVTPELLWDSYTRLQYRHMKKHPEFTDMWQKTATDYQRARRYEIEHLTFDPHMQVSSLPRPKWKQFYSAKFGPYLLAVQASLFSHNIPSSSHTLFVDTYREYLLAKQLSDDARDCLEDIRAGRITICTELLLRQCTQPISAMTDQEIERVFLQYVATALTTQILSHTKRARSLLKKLSPEHYYCSGLHQRIEHIYQRCYRLMLQREEVQLLQASSGSGSVGIS